MDDKLCTKFCFDNVADSRYVCCEIKESDGLSNCDNYWDIRFHLKAVGAMIGGMNFQNFNAMKKNISL